MKPIAIQLSEAAASDILEQADWYANQSDDRLIRRWESSITSTLLRLTEFPASGERCHFKPVELRGIRHMPVDNFPKHLVFYRVERSLIFVLRILHGARDLESLF